MKDSEFLSWIWQRMVNVHGEQSNVDYMLRLNGIILSMKDSDTESDISFEQQKPRTKTELVMVEFEKLSDAAIAVDTGEIYYTNYGEQAVVEHGLALHYYNTGNLKFYRKVEVEIDERQEFIEAAKEIIDGSKAAEYSLGAMFDSGRFKLVE